MLRKQNVTEKFQKNFSSLRNKLKLFPQQMLRVPADGEDSGHHSQACFVANL